MSTESPITRRRFTAGASAGIALPVLAACGAGGPGTASDPAGSESSASRDTTDATETGGGQAGAALATTAEIPVGGCAVFADDNVVVSQPTQGDFKAFDATCTHEGCSVSSSSDGDIPCNCHGSRFSLEDGSVVTGPATSPLPEVAITVDGDSISLA